MDIYGEVWRTGGIKTKTGDQLDDFLEIRAAKVETSGGVDSTTIGWSCLKGDFEDVFKIFLDVLREPQFRDDKLDIAQKGAFDAISRRNDEIGGIGERYRLQVGCVDLQESEIVLTRSLTYTETAALGKEQEEAFLYRVMQNDIVSQVLRRLASVRLL